MTLANNQPKTISTWRVRDCLRIPKEVRFSGSHGKVVSASGMFVRRIAVLSRIKRFLGTKHFAEFIWFHLKRFRGTKLPEDCPLWPAAYKVERIAPAWRTSPHGPTGRRTWDPSFPYHMFDIYGFPSHGQTHETTQNKKTVKVFCKTLPVFLPL